MALIEPPPPVHDDYGVSDGEWLRIDWSEHLRSITVKSELGETEVHYAELGEGPPIFFVHGLGGSWRNWLENIPAAAKNHRVVALDLPGFGTSPMPTEPISIRAYGDLIVAFADQIGLGPDTALVGHSMGGFISTEAVIEAPERFSSLTLVAAAGITFANFPQTRKQITKIAIQMTLPIASSQLERYMGRKRLRSASFKGLIAHPSMIGREILWELGTYGVKAPGMLQAAYALAGYDTRHRLAEITLPTLVIWGEQDRLVPVSAAHSYDRRIPHSELELIDDAGHMVQMERAGRFNRILEDFVSRKN
ncbi:MAG: alpha/beta fold hydrolase [Thermoleophilia bacterium]|nr:alpha/beta fold hydrolase [Thermoleophilia bacterium]